MKDIVIAIDGYSSCGKSTFAKAIASSLGYSFVDSGAMYRAVTLAALRGGVVDKAEKIIELLPSVEINFKFNDSLKRGEIYLNGECVENEIRTMEVSQKVSSVSGIAQVRAFLTEQQQQMGKAKAIVMDGRDIGTTVFPNAELKIFMTASVEVRAKRRYDELMAKGQSVSLEEIAENVAMRDHQDETRSESPLRKAQDAIVLDNSTMSVEEQMEWVKELINDRVK